MPNPLHSSTSRSLHGSHSWPHPMIRGGRRPSLLLALRVVARYTARKVMLQNMPNPPIVEDGSLVPTAAVRALLRNLPLCSMPNLFTVGFVRNPFALKAVARCFQTKARHLGMLALLTTSTRFPVRRAAGKHLLKSIRRNSTRILCTAKLKSPVQMVVARPSHH